MQMDVAGDTISVIAGGWSLAEIDLDRIPGLRIGVNDSAWRVQCAIGVTMDRAFFENRQAELRRAFPSDRTAFYYRRRIDKASIAPVYWIQFDNDHTSVAMSRDWETGARLNGTNSGICGINLAYRIKPRRVLLWGFDMCRSRDGRAYYHPPYPWAKAEGATSGGRYEEWRRQFPEIYRQFKSDGIELLNASLGSAITSIPKIKPETVLL
jgi:hypothetical protein